MDAGMASFIEKMIDLLQEGDWGGLAVACVAVLFALALRGCIRLGWASAVVRRAVQWTIIQTRCRRGKHKGRNHPNAGDFIYGQLSPYRFVFYCVHCGHQWMDDSWVHDVVIY